MREAAARRGVVALLGLSIALAASALASDPAPAQRALYLSYYGVGDRTIRQRTLDLIERTELNAVVIDVKGDRGFIPYETGIPLARAAGALGPVRVRDLDLLVAELKRKGIYTIARVVVFKDDVLAHHRPEWALTDARTGRPWVDNERLAWLDPFREEAWDYAIAVAREAVGKGFQEIQFDYLRFPADGDLAHIRYARPSTPPSRRQAITGFLARARAALDGTGALIALDIFGYTAFNSTDSEIGQRIEDLAPWVDVLCPMAYPSAYHRGIPGFPNPVAHPFEIVFETVKRTRDRAAGGRARVRPWIQDFRDYAFDRRPFTVAEVRAQIRAAEAAGAAGWMLWNPRNDYTAEALEPRVPR